MDRSKINSKCHPSLQEAPVCDYSRFSRAVCRGIDAAMFGLGSSSLAALHTGLLHAFSCGSFSGRTSHKTGRFVQPIVQGNSSVNVMGSGS